MIDGVYYQNDENGNPVKMDNPPPTGTVFWASDEKYYVVNGDGKPQYFYKPGTSILQDGQYWEANSSGTYNYHDSVPAGTMIWSNGNPLIVDGYGKQWPADQYPGEFKAILIDDYKKTIDENDDLLHLAIAGTSLKLAGKIIGIDGVQVTSKTLWKEKGSSARIGVENPNPGQRPGQIHYQDKDGKKYLYDIENGVFVDKYGILAPRSVNDNLKDSSFVQKLKEGLEKYLGVK